MPEGLNDRAADIWEPLLVLADLAGGSRPELAREAAVGLSAGKEEVSQLGFLIRHIQALFDLWATDKVFSRRLADGLRAMKNPPWAELLKGKPVTEVWLAQQLRRVDVTPRTVWIDGATARGYHLDDFEDAFARYVLVESSKAVACGQQMPSSKEGPGIDGQAPEKSGAAEPQPKG